MLVFRLVLLGVPNILFLSWCVGVLFFVTFVIPYSPCLYWGWWGVPVLGLVSVLEVSYPSGTLVSSGISPRHRKGDTMTRKDYEAIADIITKVKNREEFGGEPVTRDTALILMVIHLAEYLGDENPRFNRETFYRACGFDH